MHHHRLALGRIIAAVLLILCVVPVAAGALQLPTTTHAATSAASPSCGAGTATQTATLTATPSTATATVSATPTCTPSPTVSSTGTPVVRATVTVDPATVTAGHSIAISGSGFQPGEGIVLQIATTGAQAGAVQIGTATANSSGSFAATSVVIPSGVPVGAFQILAIGLASHRAAATMLSVKAPTATLSVNPTTFAPNDTITATGTNFQPGETVTIVLSSAAGGTSLLLGQVKADGSGSFTANGLRVPFGIAAGSLQIVATGGSSSRQASTAVTVKTTAAALSVNPTTAKPTDTIAVSGSHFQPGESVSVDLVALATTTHLGTVQADQSGSFTLNSLKVPQNTPEGTVSVVATGASSKLSASASLRVGALPATVTLSAGTVTAGNNLSLQASGFIPGETVTVQITGPSSAITLSTAVVGTNGSFSIAKVAIPAFLQAGNYMIVVSGQTSGRTARTAIVVQAPAPAAPILSVVGASLVDGAYNASPGGLLQIGGSNFPANAVATVVLVGPGGTVVLGTVKIAANGTLSQVGITLPANTPAGSYTLQLVIGGNKVASIAVRVAALTPRLSVSATAVTPGQTIAVHGTGFASGEQVVLALNGAALVTLPTAVLADSNGTFSATFAVPATLANGVNTLTASGATSRASASLTLQGTLPVAARYYFPHGDTTGDHRTVISLLNTGNAPATVRMTFLYETSTERTYSQTVPAHAEASVDLALAAGTGRYVSTIVESDRQIAAESRITYGGGDASAALGASAPGTTWYLAEGYTGGSFREYLTIMNPNTTFANVDVRFLPFNGRAPREQRFTVRPRSNIRIDAGLYMPNASISAIVTSDKGVVVERSMRFGLNRRGAHDKIGVAAASTVWQFAQGESAANRQTFFTILNPNQASPAAVTATFFDRGGKPVGQKTIVVEALRRGNIKLNDVLPNAQVATIITSNVPVVVERPLYDGSADLGTVPSGSVVFGRNGGGASWAFPGGSTANGDQTRFYLFNPNTLPSQIAVTVYTATGATYMQALTLPANSVTVLDASGIAGVGATTFGVSLRTTNGRAFIAEQSLLNPGAQRSTSTQGIAQ